MRVALLLTVLAGALMAQDMPFPVPPAPRKARVAQPAVQAAPHWVEASALTMAIARETGLPLVLCFPADADSDLASDELRQLSTTRALFIRLQRNEAEQAASIVPGCKVMSANPAASYRVSGPRDVALVCDCHGNEHFRVTGTPIAARTIAQMLDKLPQQLGRQQARLAKHLAKFHESESRRDRVVALLRAFKEDAWGLAECDQLAAGYHSLLEEGRQELRRAVGDRDAAALKQLLADFKGTELQDAIEAALKQQGG
ncbi:MAG: hypothetical protein KF696_14040 [Planctomycetes bacterium]|nr:hypothetical protein [Planctomycetota bacterium]MCW8136884.1 hypothetical protein [Planctomycetota bacterium]